MLLKELRDILHWIYTWEVNVSVVTVSWVSLWVLWAKIRCWFHCIEIFLGSRVPHMALSLLTPQQVILPPTQLCRNCHLSSFLINLIRELVQVIFLSPLFLICSSFCVAWCSAWSYLNSFFAEAIERKKLTLAYLSCLLLGVSLGF